MAKYQWARGDGTIETADYDERRDTLTGEEVKEELWTALEQFGHKVKTFAPVTGLPEVYQVEFGESDDQEPLIICAKNTTPGGRHGLMDEQRIQQKSKYINYANLKREEGKRAALLGVYRRDGQTILCAWWPDHSDAAAENPISKQIKVTTIARAMKEGFARQKQKSGGGGYSCAFRREFLYFYLRNADVLHQDRATELLQYVEDEDMETIGAAEEAPAPLCFSTGLVSAYSRNRILFGAPGTGKSFTLDREKKDLLAQGGGCERVTFHPDYSYANFVGTYKPVPCEDGITYSYVPGPFMRTYVKALKNGRTGAPKPFLLIIEEINRANVAAVFGDVFQLLDRKEDGTSRYPVQASEDVRKYLAGELGGRPEDYEELCIPDNMFLWATMNSADQGVFPMDTAFRRRWDDFTYLGIDNGQEEIAGKKMTFGRGGYRREVEWNALRRAINDELLTYRVNEDKLMGPFFVSKQALEEVEGDSAAFARLFKNKVIMYLFEDAARQKRGALFAGCAEKSRNQYSRICEEFDEKGVAIFCDAIVEQAGGRPLEDETV